MVDESMSQAVQQNWSSKGKRISTCTMEIEPKSQKYVVEGKIEFSRGDIVPLLAP